MLAFLKQYKRDAVGCEGKVEGDVDVEFRYLGVDRAEASTDTNDVVAAADDGGADIGEEVL